MLQALWTTNFCPWLFLNSCACVKNDSKLLMAVMPPCMPDRLEVLSVDQWKAQAAVEIVMSVSCE